MIFLALRNIVQHLMLGKAFLVIENYSKKVLSGFWRMKIKSISNTITAWTNPRSLKKLYGTRRSSSTIKEIVNLLLLQNVGIYPTLNIGSDGY